MPTKCYASFEESYINSKWNFKEVSLICFGITTCKNDSIFQRLFCNGVRGKTCHLLLSLLTPAKDADDRWYIPRWKFS